MCIECFRIFDSYIDSTMKVFDSQNCKGFYGILELETVKCVVYGLSQKDKFSYGQL
jgi:hypothetical protein